MSKSLGNYIGINEDADSMYGKTMSIPDHIIPSYFELATDMHPDDISELRNDLNAGSVNPRDIKMELARNIVTLYHGREAAVKAEERFGQLFQKHQLPDEIPEYILTGIDVSGEKVDVVKMLVASGLTVNSSEARRHILQGAVKINGEKISEFKTTYINDGDVVRVGKTRFIRIRRTSEPIC